MPDQWYVCLHNPLIQGLDTSKMPFRTPCYIVQSTYYLIWSQTHIVPIPVNVLSQVVISTRHVDELFTLVQSAQDFGEESIVFFFGQVK